MFRHLGDDVTYTFHSGGSVPTRVQVYERPVVAKDDSVRGLAAATSRRLAAYETRLMASLMTADVPSPKRGDSFVDRGVTYIVENVVESSPSRHEVLLQAPRS